MGKSFGKPYLQIPRCDGVFGGCDFRKSVDLSLFGGRSTRPTCRLWRLVTIDDCVGKLDYKVLWEKKNTSIRGYSQAAKV